MHALQLTPELFAFFDQPRCTDGSHFASSTQASSGVEGLQQASAPQEALGHRRCKFPKECFLVEEGTGS